LPRPTRVALALGGGGARGYAHIGVIEELERRGYEIAGVAGTSMGALVGGLHAAGCLPAYTRWVRGLTQRDVLRLLDPSLRAPGAIRAAKVLEHVAELLGDARIEDLAIPFTAIATDLLAGREVWFQRGPVAAAIRASIALPSVITPVMLHGRLLADGGLLNPIPVAATAHVAADLTIAVSLAEEHLTTQAAAPIQEEADHRGQPRAVTRGTFANAREAAGQLLDGDLVRAVTGWFDGADEEATDAEGMPPSTPTPSPEPLASDEVAEERREQQLFGTLPPGLRTRDVMQLSLDAMQSAITRYRLAGYPPDLLVTIPRAAARTLEFHRASELIDLGRERAAEALDRDGRFALG
jgi:NTE family protein